MTADHSGPQSLLPPGADTDAETGRPILIFDWRRSYLGAPGPIIAEKPRSALAMKARTRNRSFWPR